MVTIKPGTQIKRKDNIPESERTEKRDNTADVIDELWPTEKTRIAEEADCSRTHVDNVLSVYFEPIDPETTQSTQSTGDGDIEINISGDVSPAMLKMYLKGYMDAADDLSDGETQGVEGAMSQFFRVSESGQSAES